MIAQIISRLIVLFMLICIYNIMSGTGKKDKKRILIWSGLFLLTSGAIAVLYLIASK